jgi:methylmalonyl-CoA mutase C-terminal domain/subunit
MNGRPNKREPIRMLLAKPGLDGHDRGIKLLARFLAEAGIEVIYTGLRQTPEMIVETALQEDVDIIGISSHSGVHNYFLPKLINLLRDKDLDHIMVIAGGIIPHEDIPSLKKSGIAEVFGPGASFAHIIDFIKNNVR